jgi:Ca2+-binding EF-hand superfamily protein
LKEVFDLVDADHNGKISLDEVRVMLKDMDQSIPEDEIQSVLKSLDIDQTGVVNFEEFKLIFGLDSKPVFKKDSAENVQNDP